MAVQKLKDITLVLIGYSGIGKSATGNSILGEDFFDTSIAQNHVSLESQRQRSFEGLNLTVVDKPGIDDPNKIHEFFTDENCIYALVVRIGRFGDEQKSLITSIFTKHKAIFQNIIIIFSHANELHKSKDVSTQTIEGWLQKVPTLAEIIKKYNVPYVLFENVEATEKQTKQQVDNLCLILKESDETPHAKNCVSVSDKNDEVIWVTLQGMKHEFGAKGKQFWDEQRRKQHKNMHCNLFSYSFIIIYALTLTVLQLQF